MSEQGTNSKRLSLDRMSSDSIYTCFPQMKFAQPWSLTVPPADSPVDYDEPLLRDLISGKRPPTVAIHRHAQCLVATVRESRMSNFAQASQRLAATGWPVAVRTSGGSCVPQGAGVVNLSLIYPKPRGWSLEAGYEMLCALLSDFLTGYGLQPELGEVPGSFCDGRYNLQVAGKKLVGTAQRWAGPSGSQAVLAHACLLADLDLLAATERINQLYRDCGQSQQFDPFSCCTLRDCLPSTGLTTADFVASVEQRLRQLAVDRFEIRS